MDVILLVSPISPEVYKYYLLIETGDHKIGTIVEWGYMDIESLSLFKPIGRKNTIESAVSYAVRKIARGYDAIARIQLPSPVKETYQVIMLDTNKASNWEVETTNLKLAQATACALSSLSEHAYAVEHLQNGEVVYANLFENGVQKT